MNNQQQLTSNWFMHLRDQIRLSYENIEKIYAKAKNITQVPKFEVQEWQRPGGGYGQMSIMRGNVFEKVGVNFSCVYGNFTEEFAKQIPGTDESSAFFASGISLVSHTYSPLVASAHFNTRYIETSKSWFGGGGDLTPVYPDEEETFLFHEAFKNACDKYNLEYYPRFKKECDEYFYIKHRKEPRGVGGIFFDYLNNNFEEDFSFVKDVGIAFANIYPKIVEKKMMHSWTKEQKERQLSKRGRYAEFNLLYDRGTKFGLMTDGNIEAILMSMPPLASWK